MKTQLPESITTQDEAETFLYSLWENGESYHPEDNAHDIIWALPEEQKPTAAQCDQLNKLMNDIYKLEGNENYPNLAFDPCEYLLDLDEDEEKQMDLARPNFGDKTENFRKSTIQERLNDPFVEITKPIITEYRGHFFQTVKTSDSYVTYSFSDKELTQPVKAMTAAGLHEGAQKSIDKAKAKLDELLK